MSITATVENDIIKLPPGVHLPDGTRVRVEPEEPAGEGALGWMKEFAGSIDSLPPDAAARHTELSHGRKHRSSE